MARLRVSILRKSRAVRAMGGAAVLVFIYIVQRYNMYIV
jgi:hypothetical protein